MTTSAFHPETIAVHAGRPAEPGAPLNTPIVPASNYHLGAAPEYARHDATPTWEALEDAVGALEGGLGVAFSSGMAAISAIFDLLPRAARLVVPEDCYQGVARVISDGERRLGWKVMRLPNADTQRWVEAAPGADLVWLETPSNPLLELSDIATICAAAAKGSTPVAVDNTFATPLIQQPLSLGATFCVHSATKFIGGHSDLLAGLVICAPTNLGERALERIRERRTFGGATPGTLEAFLALRGLRTLALRLERSQYNAGVLAERLEGHRLVTRVRYPGLVSHPQHDLARQTLAGPGSIISFELVGSAVSTDVRLSRLRLIQRATSLGAVESCVERRARLDGQHHIAPTLCRLSVGVEHVEDLWADLLQAIDGIVEE